MLWQWLLWFRVKMRIRTVRIIRRVVFLQLLVVIALVLLLLILPPSLKRLQIIQKKTSYQKPYPTVHQQKSQDQTLVLPQARQEEPLSISEVSLRPWFMRGGKRQPQHHDPHAKIFLKDAPDEDRIIEQLMYILPKNKDLPLKKIYLPNGISAWRALPGRAKFLSSKCPVDSCLLTYKTEDAASADAVLFKDDLRILRYERNPKQIWILHFLENPFNSPKRMWPNKTVHLFNWTATYRRNSDIVTPYGKFVYYNTTTTEMKIEKNYAANKTKKVAMFVSNCLSANNRLAYARELAKHIQVDIYGDCDNKGLICWRSDPKCLQKLNTEYKFYLAFENANCHDYITEKLFLNGFEHDVIPIVMGARPSDYKAASPPNSYIHVEEFASPKELATYLHILDKNYTLYNSYFKWKGTGEFINTYFFCRVCAMLHASDQRNYTSHYTNAKTWWKAKTCIS